LRKRGGGPKKKADSGLTRAWSSRQKFCVAIAAVTAFVAALVTIAASFGSAKSSVEGGIAHLTGSSAPAWSELSIERPVSLVDGYTRQNRVGDRAQWVRSTVPQIDFIIRNSGKDRVALNRVRVEVVSSDRLTACELPQGGGGLIPATQSFFIDLPLYPSQDERLVYRRLSQEVLPERATRIKLYFRSLGLPLAYDSFADDLFDLRVSILGSQEGQELNVGSFLLSLPGAIPRGGAFLPESTAALEQSVALRSHLASTWCYRRNKAVINHFLSLAGKRSPEIEALADSQRPRGWSRFVDRRSAREAIAPLLKTRRVQGYFLSPLLALYAAQTTHDQALIATTKREAIATLRGDIETTLDGSPSLSESTDAAVEARLLWSLSTSNASLALVERSKVALRQGEVSLLSEDH
jgi:hypothetical protein